MSGSNENSFPAPNAPFFGKKSFESSWERCDFKSWEPFNPSYLRSESKKGEILRVCNSLVSSKKTKNTYKSNFHHLCRTNAKWLKPPRPENDKVTSEESRLYWWWRWFQQGAPRADPYKLSEITPTLLAKHMGFTGGEMTHTIEVPFHSIYNDWFGAHLEKD